MTSRMLAEYLGGSQALGRTIQSDFDLDDAVREGLPLSTIESVVRGGALSASELDALVIPRRTLAHRRRLGKRLSSRQSDRLTRVVRVVARAEEAIGDSTRGAALAPKTQPGVAGQEAVGPPCQRRGCARHRTAPGAHRARSGGVTNRGRAASPWTRPPRHCSSPPLHLWRLTRRAHAALDGEGARLHGARWNSSGTAVVYAASHLSLAALEYLVHIDPQDAPRDLVALRLHVPDSATELAYEPASLPAGWQDAPPRPECQAIGDRWARSSEHLLLRVSIGPGARRIQRARESGPPGRIAGKGFHVA